MDIEGAEWQVLKHLEDSGVLDLVDELLVEMHYHHPVMAGFGWNQFPKTLNETNEYFKHLRKRGLCSSLAMNGIFKLIVICPLFLEPVKSDSYVFV